MFSVTVFHLARFDVIPGVFEYFQQFFEVLIFSSHFGHVISKWKKLCQGNFLFYNTLL